MNRKRKKIIIIGLSVVIILTVLGVGIGEYFVQYALSPKSSSIEGRFEYTDPKTLKGDEKVIALNREAENLIGKNFSKETQATSIKSHDNLNLKAQYIKQENSHLWAIMIHGYKADNESMMAFGKRYYDQGYNVLLPNNRAHGTSEDYIGMGWLDKDDIASWVKWIVDQDKDAKIILHGVSMGGATTMNVAGDNLNHIVGYIEDCGYTSAWDIFASELDKQFSLPTFPILDLANMMANFHAGYDFKDASSLKQVEKSKQPILFIHGGKDDFVLSEMVYKVYEAAKCEKDIYVVKQAGHAESKDFNPEAYWNKVFTFIDQKIKE